MMKAACAFALIIGVASLTMKESENWASEAGSNSSKWDPKTYQAYVLSDNVQVITYDPDNVQVLTNDAFKSDFAEGKGFKPLLNLATLPGRNSTGPMNYRQRINALKFFLNQGENQGNFIIYADKDLVPGGCGKEELLERYHDIVIKSGAKIIFGAQLHCKFPPKGVECEEFERPQWARTAYGHHDLDAKLRKFQDDATKADTSKSLININAGFFMAPGYELLEMLEYVVPYAEFFELYDGEDVHEDQKMYSQFWSEHPEKVTLDYGAELVMNGNGFRDDAVRLESGKFYNAFNNKKQCFYRGEESAASTGSRLFKNRLKIKNPKAFEALEAKEKADKVAFRKQIEQKIAEQKSIEQKESEQKTTEQKEDQGGKGDNWFNAIFKR